MFKGTKNMILFLEYLFKSLWPIQANSVLVVKASSAFVMQVEAHTGAWKGIDTFTNWKDIQHDKNWKYNAKLIQERKFFENPSTSVEVSS